MKYKIGLILPDSNYFARLGKDFCHMVEAGLKKSGFNNYEIIIETGGFNAEVKVINEKVQNLILRDQVDVIVAPFNPAFLIEVGTFLESNEVLLLLISLGEDIIHEDHQSDFAFVNSLNLTKSAWLQGYEAGKEHGTNGASIGAFHDIGYGITLGATMGLEAVNGKFVFSTFTHKNSRVESPIEPITKVLNEEPDFLYAFYSGKEAISFIDTWHSLDSNKPPLAASYMMHSDEVLLACGKKLLGQRTIGCWDRDSKSEANVTFKEIFENDLGKKAHPYGLLAYESGELLGKALIKSGNDLTNPDAIKKALTQVTIKGPRGEVAFNPKTQVVDTVDYLFELIEEDSKLVRKMIQKVEVPEEYYEKMEWARKNVEKQGWTNPYLIA